MSANAPSPANAQDLAVARECAAAHLAETGYAQEATIVRSGQGDDFAEVRMALKLMESGRFKIWRQALETYADAGFWDEAAIGGASSDADRGTLARQALAGIKPGIRFHD